MRIKLFGLILLDGFCGVSAKHQITTGRECSKNEAVYKMMRKKNHYHCETYRLTLSRVTYVFESIE